MAFRRVSTTIYLTIRAGATSARQVVTIDPGELETALKRDAAAVDSLEADSNQDILHEAESLHRDEVHQQAIDRAENEGMIIHPNWSRQSLVTTPRPKVMSVRFPKIRGGATTLRKAVCASEGMMVRLRCRSSLKKMHCENFIQNQARPKTGC